MGTALVAASRLSTAIALDRQAAAFASTVEPTETQGTRWRGASRSLRSLVNWNPGIGSARSDTPATELRTMRARSRDAFRGHLVARAALTRPRTSIIGTGLICRPNVDFETLGITAAEAERYNAQIRNDYERWAEDPAECDFEGALDIYGLQSLGLLSAMASGDVFALTPERPRPGGVASLKVQFVEADRVCNPNNAQDSDTCIDGIQIAGGMPVGCWIRDTHPGDALTSAKMPSWDYFPFHGEETGRRRVLQIWNDKERPGQVRGVPFLAPILEPLKQIERYSGAELTAAVVSALLTVFIKRDPSLASDSGLEAFDGTGANGNIGLGQGSVVDLAPGEEPEVVNPLRPNANFDPFFVAIVKQIGAALEIPLDELLLQYNASYSAARAAMLQAWRFYLSRRWVFVQQFCAPIYGLFLDEAVASGRLSLPGYGDPVRRRAWSRALWIGPARGSMDEEKEANAAKTRIEIGVSNESMETAAMTGENWSDVFAQRQRELAARRATSTLDPDKYGVAVRAGLVTPNLADEAAFRGIAGLPAANKDVEEAWDADGGARRPITLQSESPSAQSVPGTTPENPA